MKQRLIDANALEGKIAKMLLEPDYQHSGENWRNGLHLALEAIDEAPTVDVMEVVRCNDLISRTALIEEVKKMRIVVRSTDDPFDVIRTQGSMFRKAVDEAPIVDAVEVAHGHWEKSDIPHEKFCCSVCGGACWYYDYEGDVARSRYCPNCGAKMDRGTNNAFD